MSNTFSSSLVVDTATSTAITVLQNRLAPVKTFTTDFSKDVVSGAGLRKLQVGVVANAASAVSSPTSFEAQGQTVNSTAVTMTHYSAQFGLSSQQLNQGFRLEKLMKANLRALANAILDASFAPISTSTFGASAYSSAITTATGGNIGNSLITAALPTLWSALKDGTERYLVLDGSYYSYLLPATGYSLDIQTKGAYGFDGIFYNNRWGGTAQTGIAGDAQLNGTTKTIKGFAVSPEAMAVASAIPYVDPAIAGLLQMSETIDIADLGLSVQFNVWGSLSSRSLQASFDVLFGAAAADTSALKIINA